MNAIRISLSCLLCAALLCACSVDLGVDDQVYGCVTDGDCGAGYRCDGQATPSVCVPENQTADDTSSSGMTSSGDVADTGQPDTAPPDTSSSGDADSSSSGDADVPAVLPTTPEVRIEPANPTTTDTLSVTIVSESTISTNEPLVYTYRWTRMDAEQSTEATIAPSLTSKDEVWRLEVTAVVEGTSRASSPAVAMTTIENTLPVLRSATLSAYEVWGDERIRAKLGSVIEPDAGDMVAPVVQWYRNGQLLTGAEQAGLLLDLSLITDWVDGDKISLRVAMRDGPPGGASGPAIELGPIDVHPARTHWKRLSPPIGGFDFFTLPSLVVDSPRHRLLLFVQEQIWEYSLDQANPTWVELRPQPPGGLPAGVRTPLLFQVGKPQYDPTIDRVVIAGSIFDFNGTQPVEVYTLNLSPQGGERWERLPTTGTPPTTRAFGTSFSDTQNQRVLFWGGVDFSSGDPVPDPLWSLDLSTPGEAAWAPLSPANAPLNDYIFQAAAGHPTESTAVLFGGVPDLSDTFEPVSVALILDTTLGAESFAPFADSLPGEVVGQNVVFDDDGGGLLLGHMGMGTAYQLWRFDITQQVFVEQPLQPGGPIGSIINDVTFLADSGDEGALILIAYGAGELAISPWSIFLLDIATGTWSDLTVSGQDLPRSRASTTVGLIDDAFYVFSGNFPDADDEADFWSFDLVTRSWAEVAIAPDPDHGVPGARQDADIATHSTDTTRTLYLFGGYDSNNGVDLDDVWRAVNDGTGWRWERLMFSGASLSPGVRNDPSLWVACGSHLTLFGGYSSMFGGAMNDVWQVRSCDANQDNCEWLNYTPTNATGPMPSGRQSAGVWSDGSGATILGGFGSGVDADAWQVYTCGSPPRDWTRQAAAIAPGIDANNALLLAQLDISGSDDVFHVLDPDINDPATQPSLWMMTIASGALGYSYLPLTIHDEPGPSQLDRFTGVAGENGDFYFLGGGNLESSGSVVWQLRVVNPNL